MAKMGRPKKEINLEQLKALMRLKPTQKDTAAFFECSEDTIDNVIKKNFKCTFSEFRDQNMVHTRFSLIRKAIQKAENGDNCMLIFCLKNLCGWVDKFETKQESDVTVSMEGFKFIEPK
jgi:hypothetical protein